MSGTATMPIYFDCDTGVDDALALAYLLASRAVDVVGIGSVSGNVSAAQAAENTLRLLALAHRTQVPVAVGAHDPIAGRFDGGAAHVHGENGLGGVELPHSPAHPVHESAADMLLRLSREHAGRLHVLAVGPLTNLALALARDASLADRVARVTVMGGAALAPGNITAVAEANIGNDPEAAQAVLTAGWPVTLVPLDVTMQNTLEETDRAALCGADGSLPRAVGAALDRYFDFYVTEYGRRCSALHDPLAAAIAAGGIVPVVAPLVPVEVDTTQGPGRGQTLCDLRGQRVASHDHASASVRVVLGTDRPLAGHLLTTILGRAA